ncbi:hypothetical protein ACFWPX_03090 [Nocardia sp. NPDC058518]|uniref:hypothetical protein n=1 Tax=Nocardia sp. NPDC058518 TaxID=3346534 RepID=UPI00365499F3
MVAGESALPAEGASHTGNTPSDSSDPIPVQNSVPRYDTEPADQRAIEEPLTADDEVVSAAQIVVSYLWNTEHDKISTNPASHIMLQLRTLTRWLTSMPGD